MKQKTLFLVFGICLMVLMVGQAAFAEKEPEVGLVIGNVAFSAPIAPEDATYLGLSGQKDFTLKDINAPYVLVESFNTTCPHCIAQAPVLNRLHGMAQGDSQLKGKIKFVSAGQGNDATAAKMWKAFHKVPFAVVPDKDSKLGKAMNFSPYPVSLLVDKSGKVVWVHVGSFENANEAFTEIKKVVK